MDFVRAQGYFVADHEPTEAERTSHAKVARITLGPSSYNAVRTPLDLPIAQDVIAAVKSAQGDVVLMPTMGASVPLGEIEQAAHARTITIPIANFDDNQHTANESLRLKNLWDGVATMAALLVMQ
jgi:acetylornithine deacetylase/succinyl-diaminopimelate desuccinylase-like protein